MKDKMSKKSNGNKSGCVSPKGSKSDYSPSAKAASTKDMKK